MFEGADVFEVLLWVACAGGLENERQMFQFTGVEKIFEPFYADLAFADVGVTVFFGTQREEGVIGVDELEVLQTYQFIKFGEQRRNILFRPHINTRNEEMAGVEGKTETFFVFEAFPNSAKLFDGIADAVAGAGVVLQD